MTDQGVMRFLLGPAVLLLALACGAPSESEECAAPSSDVAMEEAIRANANDNSWQTRIDDIIRSAPPDSVVKVGVLYHSSPTVEDLALLDELGAVIEHEFTALPALTIRVEVGNLAALAKSERVRSISLPLSVYPTGCGP